MNRAERRAAKAHPSPQHTDKVTVGFIHPGTVSTTFLDSLFKMQNFEMKQNGRSFGLISKHAGAGWIAGARNFVTQEFLNTDSDWLLFIDTDMGFAPWSLTRMLSVATHDGFKPIIGGLCFALTTTGWDPETNAETYECFPTIGIWNRGDDGNILGYRHLLIYDKDTVLKVDQTGAAFILIHRSVMEKIGSDWWTFLDVPEGAGLEHRGHFSEDVSWCIRVAEAGFDIWLDTMTKTSHHKQMYVTEQSFDLQLAIRGIGT